MLQGYLSRNEPICTFNIHYEQIDFLDGVSVEEGLEATTGDINHLGHCRIIDAEEALLRSNRSDLIFGYVAKT